MNTTELTPQIQESLTQTVAKVQPLAEAAWEFHTALAKLIGLSLRYVDLKARDQVQQKWPDVQEQVQSWWQTNVVPAQNTPAVPGELTIEQPEETVSEVAGIVLAALVAEADAGVKDLTSEFSNETSIEEESQADKEPASTEPEGDTSGGDSDEPDDDADAETTQLRGSASDPSEKDDSTPAIAEFENKGAAESETEAAIAQTEDSQAASELEPVSENGHAQGFEDCDHHQDPLPTLGTESSLNQNRRLNKRSKQLV